MSEFLYLFRGGDVRTLQDSPEAMQQHMEKWRKWMGELASQGKLVGGQPLDSSGKLVKGTKKVITDGPFTEGKEVVGGYLIVKAGNLNEAAEISRDCPIFENDGTVEIRPIQEMTM